MSIKRLRSLTLLVVALATIAGLPLPTRAQTKVPITHERCGR